LKSIVKTPLALLETPEQISEADTETLRLHLSHAVELTVRTIAYMAAIWAELTRRGEDLSDLKSGISRYLPQIADGSVDASVIVKCAGQPGLLRAMAAIPIEEQRKVLKRGTVQVVRGAPGVKMEILDVPLSRLDADDVQVAFSRGGLRKTSDQMEYRVAVARKKAQPPRVGSIEFRGDDVILIDRRAVTLRRLLSAVGGHFGVDLNRVVAERNVTPGPSISRRGMR